MVIDRQPVSDLPIPPGEYLAEVLGEAGLSQRAFAARLGRPVQAISEIIRGHKEITPRTALEMANVLSVPAHVWLALECEYRLALARLHEAQELQSELDLLDSFPLKQLKAHGFIGSTRKDTELVQQLRRFLGVASLDQLSEVNTYAAAFRCAPREKASPHALIAWIRAGEHVARRQTCAEFNRTKLAKNLNSIRELTSAEPGDAGRKLLNLLLESGVRFVLLPHWDKTYIQGAVYWINKHMPVIQMSVRGKRADVFWFSLFHGLGHLLLHKAGRVFIEHKDLQGEDVDAERQADEFARDCLIQPAEYQRFIEEEDYSEDAVVEFAKSIGIAPGIVVGRLQHEKHIGYYSHVKLIAKLQLKEN